MFDATKRNLKIYFANSIESHENICLEKDYSIEQIFLIGYETTNYLDSKTIKNNGQKVVFKT